ncbi:hypothetical protein Tco_0129351 [Tanacetum coccineum]
MDATRFVIGCGVILLYSMNGVSSLHLSFFLVMTKSDLEDIGGLKTCSAASSLLDGSTDPGMVDPCAFMVDPSGAIPADDPTKFMDLVPLVDALILSNPRPILQLDDF